MYNFILQILFSKKIPAQSQQKGTQKKMLNWFKLLIEISINSLLLIWKARNV